MRLMILLIIACAIVTGGCTTAGRRSCLIVANASDHQVSNVIVESDGFTHYTAASVDPHSEAHSERFKRKIVRTATIRWTPQGGDMVAHAVQLNPPSPETFRGRIYIQIQGNSDVRVFFLEGSNTEEGVLPWPERQPWEGSPSIPGLNRE